MKKVFIFCMLAASIIFTFFNWQYITFQTGGASKEPKSEKFLAKSTKKIETRRSPDFYAAIERQKRTPDDQSYPEYPANYKMEAYAKAVKFNRVTLKNNEELNFISRGPGNIAGRTRAILVDPRDTSLNTWLVGSASGGIWKTIDGGFTWTEKTSNLPNLGTSTLASSANNPDVIYAGTGEHFVKDFDGNGLFKSIDNGTTWIQVADPAILPDFRNVSRIIVDPNNEQVVLATTRNSVWEDPAELRSSIYKTTDGGQTWNRVYSLTDGGRLDDIDVAPGNFNIQYAAINGGNVIKSTDGGETWNNASLGLNGSGRVEITVSPVDPNYIWASVEAGGSGNASLFVSTNRANTWSLVNDENSSFDFLGGQGWYDNIITAHPFDKNTVYVGGVNLFKFELIPGVFDSTFSIQPEERGTEQLMDFVDFGGAFLRGGMQLGSITYENLVPIEIRFGAGTQKGHRFIVNGQGSRVPADGYIYQNYVDLPFQVWDTKNNRQLMVSFRDQQEDGAWNLIEFGFNGPTTTHPREYLFVHLTPYADSPHPSIARNGGHEFEQQYFFWPVLRRDAIFDPNDLPGSTLAINHIEAVNRKRRTSVISDAYFQFNGNNSAAFGSKETGIHPDHHNIVILPTGFDNGKFRLLVGNDGGVYLSDESSDPGVSDNSFTFQSFGYLSTQFYSADKAPGTNRYVGGMQDNSTWFSPNDLGTDGFGDDYKFLFGGDGFEVLWNNQDPDLILGGSQFNSLRKSRDGGYTTESAIQGLDDVGIEKAPFITRLSNSKKRPNVVFTVGFSGVWKSINFGDYWSLVPTMPNQWTIGSSLDIEVSTASPNFVWAGGALSENQRLFVSTDGGDSFAAVNPYDGITLGRISGIGTNPIDNNTAYALFSFAKRPKVIKTNDLGESWVDISGFENSFSGESTSGFPDVAVNTLLVFPTDTNRIWVGSEIGIIETLDGGQSWGLLESNLPAVNIYDFKIQDDQIIIATYGQGIWTVDVPSISPEIYLAPTGREMVISPDGQTTFDYIASSNFDSVQVFVDGTLATSIPGVEKGIQTITLNNLGLDGLFSVVFTGHFREEKLESLPKEFFFFEPTAAANSFFTDFASVNPDAFAGIGISRLRIEPDFRNEAAHTEHPYPEGAGSLFYLLKTPLEVVGNDAILSYEDVAIIEPSEIDATCSSFFIDYAVVEGSIDGRNWLPLANCYDAAFNDNWSLIYEEGSTPVRRDMVNQAVDLLQTFNTGDVILVRFRLFSDPLVTGWGWAFDNVSYQPQATPTKDDLANKSNLTRVFPNPASNQITIVIPSSIHGDKQVSLINIEGKVIQQFVVGDNINTLTIDRNHLSSGLYFVRISYRNRVEAHKVFLVL